MRRELLIERMEELEAKGHGCIGCPGTCCTFEANSMMITPLETVELLQFLNASQQKTAELKAKMEATVSSYRLNQDVSTGKRTVLRRTYTCPFFGHQELGCPLPRTVKPYGCLAFDSHHETEKAGAHCYSETAVLEAREEKYATIEKQLNQELKVTLNLNWEKAPIPVALLELWDRSLPTI